MSSISFHPSSASSTLPDLQASDYIVNGDIDIVSQRSCKRHMHVRYWGTFTCANIADFCVWVNKEITSWLIVVDTGMLALQAGAYHTQGVVTSARTPACAMGGAKPTHRHNNSFDVSQPNKSTLRPTLGASCKSQPYKALPGAVQVN